MYFGFVYFIVLLNLVSLVSGHVGEEAKDLCFVAIIFRHGDRAPSGFYPTDPYRDNGLWPKGWGQLTKLGELQQYELGKWIRNRYSNFLPVRYNSSDIYVLSTDVDRSLVSAYCNLAGLYETFSKEETGLSWQPVPVHTIPQEMDSVLLGAKKCPAYDNLIDEVMKSEEMCTINKNYSEVFFNLSAHTELNISTVRDCLFLYNVLNIQNLYGFRLPDWSKNYFPEPLKEINEVAFKIPCWTPSMMRLKCGPLLKEILTRMEEKQKGKITQKMWLYSAHDSTLANLLQCLNVYDGMIPPYTATVLFEMFVSRNHKYYVSVLYKTPTTLTVLRLPCCKKTCPFETFKVLLKPIIPDNWESECQEQFWTTVLLPGY